MELVYTATDGPQCHITTIADMATRQLDLSHLPEFAFSPKKGKTMPPRYPEYLPWKTKPHHGPIPPPSITNPRKLHSKREIGPIEEGHRDLRPFFKTPIKSEGFVAPINALEGIDRLRARVEAIKRLTDQQERDKATDRALIEADKELPTIVDEFRANGFKAVFLSSSNNDEDDDDNDNEIPLSEDVNWNAKRLGKVASAIRQGDKFLSLEEAAPVLRRIEWEKYTLACDQQVKVRLTNGGAVSDNPNTPPRLVQQLGRKIRAACEGVDIANGRARAGYYGVVGSSLHGRWTGAHWPEQSMDLDEDDAHNGRVKDPDKGSQGELELGFHGLGEPEPRRFGLPHAENDIDGTDSFGYKGRGWDEAEEERSR